MKAYQLKITIKDSKPPIWRRCVVPAGLSFSQLTLVLHEVMGWCGYHLSEYYFHKFGVVLSELSDDDFYDNYSPYTELDSSEYLIDEFFEEVKSFIYTYDFGDNWEHKVQIEKVLEDYEYTFPMVLKYKGETPPEDCGGIWGYEHLLEVLDNPKDPEYESLSEWYEGLVRWDYDIDVVNKELSMMKKTMRNIKPITERKLQEKRFKGKLRFDQVMIPEEREAFGQWDDFNEDEFSDSFFGIIDNSVNKMIAEIQFGIYVEVVKSLRSNTKMSDKNIKKALEFSDDFWNAIDEYLRE